MVFIWNKCVMFKWLFWLSPWQGVKSDNPLKDMAPSLSWSTPRNLLHWWNHLKFRLQNRKSWDEMLDETFLCQSKRLFYHKYTDTCHSNQLLKHDYIYCCVIISKWYCAMWIIKCEEQSVVINTFAPKMIIIETKAN